MWPDVCSGDLICKRRKECCHAWHCMLLLTSGVIDDVCSMYRELDMTVAEMHASGDSIS